MTPDHPLVEEVRARRMALSARFGHDAQRYFDHLRQVQRRYADRLVSQITVVKGGVSQAAVKPDKR